MKKLLSLILAMSLIALTVLATASCSKDDSDEDPPAPVLPTEPEPDPGTDPPEDDGYDDNGIIIPEYKDYGRGTRDFDLLAEDYVRPNVADLCERFAATAQLIRQNTVSYEEQLSAILSLEASYNSFKTMYSLAEIFSAGDLDSEYWAAELEYVSASAPSVTLAAERLLTACAASEHVARFESEYFMRDISEYEDGGIYNDEAIEHMAEEARLEAEYMALSPSTVEISYQLNADETITGSYEQVVEQLEEIYKSNSGALANAKLICSTHYKHAYGNSAAAIYAELLKVRHQIAHSLGYTSYIEYAYDVMGYEYSSEQFDLFTEDVASQIGRIRALLYSSELSKQGAKLSSSSLVNNTYSVIKEMDAEFGDIYSFMLQHGLYDVAAASATRQGGAFTATLPSNASPFLFISTSGYISDYLSLTHEFGHFIDCYVNNSSQIQLEIAETCGQALPLLALSGLQSHMSTASYDRMVYQAIMGTVNDLYGQCAIALFEHLCYAIPYEEISVDAIELAVAEVEHRLFDSSGDFSVSDMLTLHVFLEPMYVQSYCTSSVVALDIYSAELEDAGAGIEAYKRVIMRDEETFSATLSDAGLSSPMAEGSVAAIALLLEEVLGPLITKYG